MDPARETFDISRRTLLIGGGIGVGLLIGWTVLPRRYAPNLRAAPGETIFNAYLKIGTDGRVVVAVPQSELGQGVYTSLPQILADELGADWRTVSVEPAPISPIYANRLLAEEIAENRLPDALRGISDWAVREYATRSALMLTAGSTSIRAFDAAMREAGAAGRALLSRAAADRWNVDWETLDTRSGFVVRGNDRISFAELAGEAAGKDLPEHLPVRGGDDHRLVGQSVPRLDLPSKVDGSAQYASDVRLPGMVYGAVRQGPIGESKLIGVNRKAARGVAGVLALIEQPGWAGAVASNWWAANRAVELMVPRFETRGPLVGSGDVDAALARALDRKGSRLFSRGDAESMFDRGGSEGGRVFRAGYQVGLAPSAAMETLSATVRLTGDRVEVWAPTQAPGFARAAAARAAGVSEEQVTLYRSLIGGGYGRKLETQAIEQAVAMALQVKRPVQLVWSRIEETMHDSFRRPARALLTASLGQGNMITGWHARIAAPSTLSEVSGRLRKGKAGRQDKAEEAAIAGANPPYAIAAVAVDHLPAAIGVPTGVWRSGAHSYTAFFTECFVDELAREAKIEPLSFRMQMLGENPRLARALSSAAALGGWDGGGPGSMMGIAAHSAFGSHAATLVEVEIDSQSGAQRVRVTRAVCAVDCGRIVNPDIVRQQIEGGLMFGIGAATGNRIAIERGLVTARGFGQLGLPTMASTPDIIVELIASDEDPGGVTELAVPTAAPAIANALFALTGRRIRSLPLEIGSSS
ncbi:MAG: isoquinoline 1-oxidoreductase [Alphaproteobacteria bacterium]|nr:isoquinoline 1-oxidoreductase [Alphaproteobacteria bacterium]